MTVKYNTKVSGSLSIYLHGGGSHFWSVVLAYHNITHPDCKAMLKCNCTVSQRNPVHLHKFISNHMPLEPSLNWVRRIWHKTDTISVSAHKAWSLCWFWTLLGTGPQRGFKPWPRRQMSISWSFSRFWELHSSALPGHRTGAVFQLWGNLMNGFQVWKVLCRKEPLTEQPEHEELDRGMS